MYLKIVSLKRDGTDGSIFAMTGPTCTIGKSNNCSLRVKEADVQDVHCEVYMENDQIYLKAVAPTYCKGKEVFAEQPVVLNDKDTFKISDKMFRIEIEKRKSINKNAFRPAENKPLISRKRSAGGSFRLTPSLEGNSNEQALPNVQSMNFNTPRNKLPPKSPKVVMSAAARSGIPRYQGKSAKKNRPTTIAKIAPLASKLPVISNAKRGLLGTVTPGAKGNSVAGVVLSATKTKIQTPGSSPRYMQSTVSSAAKVTPQSAERKLHSRPPSPALKSARKQMSPFPSSAAPSPKPPIAPPSASRLPNQPMVRLTPATPDPVEKRLRTPNSRHSASSTKAIGSAAVETVSSSIGKRSMQKRKSGASEFATPLETVTKPPSRQNEVTDTPGLVDSNRKRLKLNDSLSALDTNALDGIENETEISLISNDSATGSLDSSQLFGKTPAKVPETPASLRTSFASAATSPFESSDERTPAGSSPFEFSPAMRTRSQRRSHAGRTPFGKSNSPYVPPILKSNSPYVAPAVQAVTSVDVTNESVQSFERLEADLLMNESNDEGNEAIAETEEGKPVLSLQNLNDVSVDLMLFESPHRNARRSSRLRKSNVGEQEKSLTGQTLSDEGDYGCAQNNSVHSEKPGSRIATPQIATEESEKLSLRTATPRIAIEDSAKPRSRTATPRIAIEDSAKPRSRTTTPQIAIEDSAKPGSRVVTPQIVPEDSAKPRSRVATPQIATEESEKLSFRTATPRIATEDSAKPRSRTATPRIAIEDSAKLRSRTATPQIATEESEKLSSRTATPNIVTEESEKPRSRTATPNTSTSINNTSKVATPILQQTPAVSHEEDEAQDAVPSPAKFSFKRSTSLRSSTSASKKSLGNSPYPSPRSNRHSLRRQVLERALISGGDDESGLVTTGETESTSPRNHTGISPSPRSRRSTMTVESASSPAGSSLYQTMEYTPSSTDNSITSSQQNSDGSSVCFSPDFEFGRRNSGAKKSAATPCFMGMKELLRTPKPVVAASPHIDDVRLLFGGERAAVTNANAQSATKNVRDLFQHNTKQAASPATPDFRGLKEMVQLPKKSVSPHLNDLRHLYAGEKAALNAPPSASRFVGVREMYRGPDNRKGRSSDALGDLQHMFGSNVQESRTPSGAVTPQQIQEAHQLPAMVQEHKQERAIHPRSTAKRVAPKIRVSAQPTPMPKRQRRQLKVTFEDGKGTRDTPAVAAEDSSMYPGVVAKRSAAKPKSGPAAVKTTTTRRKAAPSKTAKVQPKKKAGIGSKEETSKENDSAAVKVSAPSNAGKGRRKVAPVTAPETAQQQVGRKAPARRNAKAKQEKLKSEKQADTNEGVIEAPPPKRTRRQAATKQTSGTTVKPESAKSSKPPVAPKQSRTGNKRKENPQVPASPAIPKRSRRAKKDAPEPAPPIIETVVTQSHGQKRQRKVAAKGSTAKKLDNVVANENVRMTRNRASKAKLAA